MQNATDIEGLLIGSLVLRNEAVWDLPDSLTPRVFQHGLARRCFEAIRRLSSERTEFDAQTLAVAAKLSPEETDWLQGATEAGSFADLRVVADELLENRRRTEVERAARECLDALRSGASADEALAALSRASTEIGADTEPVKSLEETYLEFFDDVGAREKIPRLKTGFDGLDAILKITPGNFILVAAQTGHGKSTFALNVAENIARAGRTVLVHSLEMNAIELTAKVISRNTQIAVDRLIADPLYPHEQEKVGAFNPKLPMFFNTSHFDIDAIIRISERMHRRHRLGLVVLDYVQLVEADLGKRASQEERFGYVSRRLKKLGQQTGVPVMAVAQFNRDYDKRQQGDKSAEVPPPKLSDLFGSSRFEKDANSVLLLYNPFALSDDIERRLYGPYRILVAKQRTGKKLPVNVRAKFEHSTFLEVT